MNKITIDYDNEGDVLYISFGEPKESITEEINNIGIRLDEKTNELTGITIINFLKEIKKGNKPIEISV
ncbi:DUF2283 domain-containing protein [Candidatus Woesearchaeota archaeon]|nr:DUF2283 domain-containing protein [Candidatus Woesearchaeota archaeon]HIH25355.1 DUF2283 domain-containing protein [Nanoarchaeota archaeon]